MTFSRAEFSIDAVCCATTSVFWSINQLVGKANKFSRLSGALKTAVRAKGAERESMSTFMWTMCENSFKSSGLTQYGGFRCRVSHCAECGNTHFLESSSRFLCPSGNTQTPNKTVSRRRSRSRHTVMRRCRCSGFQGDHQLQTR